MRNSSNDQVTEGLSAMSSTLLNRDRNFASFRKVEHDDWRGHERITNANWRLM